MFGFKTSILAVALAMVAAAPALAGMNGTESIDRMLSARRSQSAAQVRPVGTQWQWTDVSARGAPAVRSNQHRYRGGPRSLH